MQKTTTLSVNSHSMMSTAVISCESDLLLTKKTIILNKGPFQVHPIIQTIRARMHILLHRMHNCVHGFPPPVQSIKLIREPQAFTAPLTSCH